VAASLIKFREATETDAGGVVFLFVLNRKTTPASRPLEAPQHFIDRSATPYSSLRMKICFMFINRSRACGKCEKAERCGEAFASSCGNPHPEKGAAGYRWFGGFPSLRHFPQAVFFFGTFFFY
jgi:hypothetical protein